MDDIRRLAFCTVKTWLIIVKIACCYGYAGQHEQYKEYAGEFSVHAIGFLHLI